MSVNRTVALYSKPDVRFGCIRDVSATRAEGTLFFLNSKRRLRAPNGEG